MKQTRFEIPKELSHLKLDPRGYPIPYFVPIIDGLPNFRFLHTEKQDNCFNRHLCPICGKKLNPDYSYIVTGPIGMKNQVSTDPAMHRVCAEFSMLACPHLFYQKAERKETAGPQTYIINEKPDKMMLVKCKTKFKWKDKKQRIFGYQYVSHEEYIYENNMLVKKVDAE